MPLGFFFKRYSFSSLRKRNFGLFSHFRAPLLEFWHWVDTMAFICGNQILAYVFYESLSIPIFFWNGKYFPFQIFFGTESDIIDNVSQVPCKCQHSQFTYSLLIKRNLIFFERVPLSQPGFEPGTSRTADKRLTT